VQISQSAETFTNDDFENLRNAGFEAVFEGVKTSRIVVVGEWLSKCWNRKTKYSSKVTNGSLIDFERKVELNFVLTN